MKLKEFLLGIDTWLQKKHLKFVVIRNYEELPNTNTGNDIDIIVPGKSLNEWLEILEAFCKDNKLSFTINNQHFYCTSTVIEGVDDKNGQLKLDLNNRFNWRGVEFYSSDILVKNAKSYKSPIYTSQYDYINWYITFCHSFLYGGFIPAKYIKQIKKSINSKPEEFNQLLSSIFTKNQTQYLTNKIQSEDCNVPKYIANKIRISVLLRSVIKKPASTLKYFFLSYYYD